MIWLRSRKDLALAKRKEEAGAFSPSPSDWLSMDLQFYGVGFLPQNMFCQESLEPIWKSLQLVVFMICVMDHISGG